MNPVVENHLFFTVMTNTAAMEAGWQTSAQWHSPALPPSLVCSGAPPREAVSSAASLIRQALVTRGYLHLHVQILTEIRLTYNIILVSVHNMVIQYLYTFQNHHHGKSVCSHTKLFSYYWAYSFCCTSPPRHLLMYNQKLVPVTPFTYFAQPPAPSSLTTTNLFLYIYESVFILFAVFFRFHTSVKPYSFCLSLFDFFHLAKYPLSLSMLSQMAQFLEIVFQSVYIYKYIVTTFLSIRLDGHWGCFHIWAIVNNAAMNMEVHVSSQISVFVFFR